MIDLYTWPTPNGHKMHIMLEETGLDYKVIPIDIGAGDHRPGAMVVGRDAVVRFPGNHEYRQAVVGFLMQHMNAEILFRVGVVIFGFQPGFIGRQALGEGSEAIENLTLIDGLRGDAPEVRDKIIHAV